MTIPFTQFLRPDGRRRNIEIERSTKIEQMAKMFIEAGGWFECEELSTGHVSLTACRTIDNEPQDIIYELVPNGPTVPEAVDRLVEKAVMWEPGK